MESDCIFCQILEHKIPAKIIYEDDLVIAFDDINPKAPIHKVIIPREHIPSLNDLTEAHNHLIGHMIQVAKKIAADRNIDKSGYRVLFNCNSDAGQVVFHIHMHLLGGRSLTWPPG